MLRVNDVVDGRALAFARIGVGLSGLFNCVEAWVKIAAIAERDTLRVQGAPWLAPVSTGLTGLLAGVGAMAAVFVVAGLATRPSAAVLAGSLGALVLAEQQTYSNHLALTCWCALWLVVSRADARWSLRSRLVGHRDVRVGDQVLLMTQLSVVYAFTGVLKINDEFLSGRVIQAATSLAIPDHLARAMAIAAVATELLLVVGLWIRPLRWVVALAGIGLHLSIPLVMDHPAPLASFSIGVLFLYPLFFVRPLERVSEPASVAG